MFLNLPDQIEFLDMEINKSSAIKFLGLTSDENLSWDLHINELSNKLKSLFHKFYNIRDFLNEKDIKMLYFTLVFSRIKYGIAARGSKMNMLGICNFSRASKQKNCLSSSI